MAEPYDISSPAEEERKRERQDRMYNRRPVLDLLTHKRDTPRPKKGRGKKVKLSATEKRDRDAQRRQLREEAARQLREQTGRQPSQREVNQARQGSRSRFTTRWK